MRKNTTQFIYALFYESFPTEEHLSLGPVDVIFYVGKTSNLARRMSGHRSRSKTGTEAKYVFIRDLEQKRIAWDIVELAKVEPGDNRPHERFAIIEQLRQGANLQNMRHGDLNRHVDGVPGISAGQLRQLADDRSIQSVDELEARMREGVQQPSVGSDSPVDEDATEKVIRTQARAIEQTLRTAHKRIETSRRGDVVREDTVYDRGPDADEIRAESGMKIEDIARLIAPANRARLDKLLDSSLPLPEPLSSRGRSKRGA